MKKYFATFGLGHDQQGCIQPIKAVNENEAHKLMFEKYGPKFAFVYDEEEFQAEAEFNRGKTYLPLIEQEV